MAEKRTFLDDISEEERLEMHKNPEYQKWSQEIDRQAKECQLKLRQEEQNSKLLDKEI